MTSSDKKVLNILHSVERQCDSLSRHKDTIIDIQANIIKSFEVMSSLDSIKVFELKTKVSNRDLVIKDLTKKNSKLVKWNTIFKITIIVLFTALILK